MPALTTSLFAAAAAFSGFSAIRGIFSGKSKDNDKPGSGPSGSATTTPPRPPPPPPPTSNFRSQTTSPSGSATTTRLGRPPPSPPTSNSRSQTTGPSGSATTTQPRRPPPPPPTSNSRSQTTTRTPTSSSDHVHNRDSYYNCNQTVTSGTRAAAPRPAPSASTHAQPSYQQPVYPRAAQATVQTKESLEFSDHIHRQTLPTSTTHSHVPSSAQSTRSQADQVAYLHKLREQRAILSSYQASKSRQTPTTSVARAQVLHPTLSTPSHVDKPTSSTSDHLDTWASLTPSHARVSPQTTSTSVSPARVPQSTPSHVERATSSTSDHLDTWARFPPSYATVSPQIPSTSVSPARVPQSTPSHVEKATSSTSDHLDAWASLTPSHVWLSPQTPSTFASPARAPQPTPSCVGKATLTSDHFDAWASLTPSHVWVSPQTPSTSASPARAPRLTPSRVGNATSTTSDHLDTLDPTDPWTGLASSPARVSGSARTHASYLGQQTTPQVGGQNTLRTSTMADYDGSARRSGLISRNAEEPRVVYPDSPMISPYSCLRPPSPDTDRVRVSRLPASPKKHYRTQSSSSDSDHYLGPSSPSRVVPRSRTPLSDQLDPFDDPVTNAERNKKASELREKARRSNREMRDARDQAKNARRMGDRAAESECNQAARAHESAMKNFNKNAAKIIFRVKNQHQEEGTVDLHGLYVPEAVEYAKEELQSAVYRDDNMVSFIVGKGLHAKDGVSKLRPALEDLFEARSLRYMLDPENSGKLIVYL